MNKPQHAFTLIELLVVVAIIAALISILLPSMGRAKEQAKSVVCGSNLHQVHIGAMAYGSANKDLIPLPPLWFSSPPYHTRNAYVDGTSRWYGMGLLHRTEMVGNPETFYCPSQTASWLVHETYVLDDGTWGMPPTDFYLRVGYQWTPYKDTNATSFAPYERFVRYPEQKILAMDVALSAPAHAHSDLNGWNRLFTAGHVTFKVDDEAKDLIYTSGAALWPTFEPIVELLERP